jgi:hypothetical protein
MTPNVSIWRSVIVLTSAFIAVEGVAENPKPPAPAANHAPAASAALALPDLAIVSSEDFDQLPITYVGITVRNVGGSDSTKATILRTRCVTEAGKARCGSGTSFLTMGNVAMDYSRDAAVPPLHKGESFTTTASYYFGEDDSDFRLRFTAVVDPDNLLAESNKSNNTSTFTRSRRPGSGFHASVGLHDVLGAPTPTPTPVSGTYSVALGKASLFVPPHLTLSVSPAYAPGQSIWLVAKNNSGVALVAGTTKIRCDGAPCQSVDPNSMPIPALAPGQWETLGSFQVNIDQWVLPSTHTVTISTGGVASKTLTLQYP